MGINFIEFLQDRVRGLYKIPRLAELIRQHAIRAFRAIIFRCASSALAALGDKRTVAVLFKAIASCALSFRTELVHQRIMKVFTEKISDFDSANSHIATLTA